MFLYDALMQSTRSFLQPFAPTFLRLTSLLVWAVVAARTEVIKKIWDYIKANGLQDATNKRAINADAKLKPVFGKDQVTMFELAGIAGKHLRPIGE